MIEVADYRPVAPFTGAWIEIVRPINNVVDATNVAPFTGAWIEMHDP